MKTILTLVAATALAVSISAPASAQQAQEQLAAKHSGSGGQCAVTQAMLAAIADNKQQHMTETKSRIDSLIENALAASRSVKLGQSPVKLGKASLDDS